MFFRRMVGLRYDQLYEPIYPEQTENFHFFKKRLIEADQSGAFKTEISKIKGKCPAPITFPNLLHKMMTNVFIQTMSTANFSTVQVDLVEFPMVSKVEILEALKKITENKELRLVSRAGH